MSDNSNNSNILNARNAPIPLTPAKRLVKQKKFLKAYGEVGVIKHACKIAGINRSTYYDWRDNDPSFQALLPEAREEANDTLEYAAYEQAVLGAAEPVVSMGKVVRDDDGHPLMAYKKSPQLLVTLLKANMPDRYREKSSVDLTANVTANVTQAGSITIDTKHLTNEELVTLKQLALAMKARQTE